MNPDPIPELRDVLWRRELTPDEERRIADWLRTQPGAAPEWRADLALGRAVRKLPDVPVASNFTRRVLAEVERETRRPAAPVPWWQRWLDQRWIPGVGFAAVLASVGLATWAIRDAKRATDYAHEVAALRALSGLSPTVLEDFEAIRRLGETSAPVDFGLLAALQ